MVLHHFGLRAKLWSTSFVPGCSIYRLHCLERKISPQFHPSSFLQPASCSPSWWSMTNASQFLAIRIPEKKFWPSTVHSLWIQNIWHQGTNHPGKSWYHPFRARIRFDSLELVASFPLSTSRGSIGPCIISQHRLESASSPSSEICPTWIELIHGSVCDSYDLFMYLLLNINANFFFGK